MEHQDRRSSLYRSLLSDLDRKSDIWVQFRSYYSILSYSISDFFLCMTNCRILATDKGRENNSQAGTGGNKLARTSDHDEMDRPMRETKIASRRNKRSCQREEMGQMEHVEGSRDRMVAIPADTVDAGSQDSRPYINLPRSSPCLPSTNGTSDAAAWISLFF